MNDEPQASSGQVGTASGGSSSQRTLVAKKLGVGYRPGSDPVVSGVDLEVRPGTVTVLIGGNGCGKSTILKTLGRLLPPVAGEVSLGGTPIGRWGSKDFARKVALLPQQPVAPEGVSVWDVVSRGRYPHQGWLRGWGEDDERAVRNALHATGTTELANRPIDELSGGQRQRVWVALTLAQETDFILLDEPTTFLDVHHQIELLDLLFGLSRERRVGVVMVLHDMNLACRYADDLVAVRGGRVEARGEPGDIMDADLVSRVFGLECVVVEDPVAGTPLVVPRGKHPRR